MKLSNFRFKLPESKIALHPHSIERKVTNSAGETTVFTLKRPDEAKMMVLHKKSQRIEMYHTDDENNPIVHSHGAKQIKTFKNKTKYFIK